MSKPIKKTSRRTITHEQAAWYDMIYRCQRPKHPRYPDYGAKGIKVCKQWCGKEGRQAFVEFMGPKPSPDHVLGRLDMTGNYEPKNVAWMTRSEARRRQVNTVTVDTKDGPVAVVTLAEEIGRDGRNTRRRMTVFGWTADEALNEEPDYRKLTAEQAIEIYKARQKGEPCAPIAKRYGVSVNLVSQIGNGDKWASVTGART